MSLRNARDSLSMHNAWHSLPTELLVRILAFAGQIHVIDSLSTYFRSIAMSKRLLHMSLYRSTVSSLIPSTPSEMATQLKWKWSDMQQKQHQLHIFLDDACVIFDMDARSMERHEKEVSAKRIKALDMAPIHTSRRLKWHLHNPRERYTHRPPLSDYSLRRYREGLFELQHNVPAFLPCNMFRNMYAGTLGSRTTHRIVAYRIMSRTVLALTY